MRRTLVALTLASLLAPAALGDVLIVLDRKGRQELEGMPSKVEGVDITLDNFRAFLHGSTGVIESDNYDAVVFKKTERATKQTTYPRSLVVETIFTTEPNALLDGYDLMATQNWKQAIGAFREVANNAEEATVFRLEAAFQIGACFVQMGDLKGALAHLKGQWPRTSKSKYTPEVFSTIAAIETAMKRYGQARAWYKAIGALPDIPATWAYSALLGGVKVDVAERKFDAAEQSAKSIASKIGSNQKLNDPLALALALQADAIRGSGNRDRLKEAQAILEKAAGLTGVSEANKAFVYGRLGDVMYMQGQPEEARFPYLRVALMYPGSGTEVAHALRNAGQCFLDMSDRNKGEPKKYDDYLVKGINLLRECAAKYRGTTYARESLGVYGKRKAEYDEAVQRQQGD